MEGSLASRFHALFLGLERAHGEYRLSATTNTATPKKKGKAKTVLTPVTDKAWQQHLDGEVGLGVIPINDDNHCRWGAIDIDSYENFHPEALSLHFQEKNLPLIVCRTKSGGAHCYLFTIEPVPAELMRKKLKEVAISIGWPDEEIFPKQDELTQADVGNWINMPYFEAEMTMRFAFENGKSIQAERFLEYAASQRITLEQLQELSTVDESAAPLIEEFEDAPPCLQHFASVGFPQGSRNNALFSMGVYARRKFEDSWQDKIFEYNQRFMGPGTYAEVQAIIKALSKRTYFYKCLDQPICSVCNKEECRKRKFGITSKENKEEGPCVLDEVDRPIKKMQPAAGTNDEQFWIFKIGGRAFDVTIDMVRDQDKFLREYLKKFDRLVIPVKFPTWARKMNDLLVTAEVVDLPPDAGPEGQFIHHLEAFCTGKVQARAQEELLLGKPWTDGGKTYFRSKDLMKYLDQQHFREYKERQIWPILRRHGADHGQCTLKGACVTFWYIPEFSRQSEDFDMPEVEQPPF